MAGLDGVSLVFNPGPFDVVVALSPEGVGVSATLSLAPRFASTILRPMRAVMAGSTTTFEPDPSVGFVQIFLPYGHRV